MDWSDHAMWWPDRNIWLDKTRWTLDQYNITADAVIHFTPMHKTLRVQLPDLRYIDCNVDFSIKTFNASVNLCKELGESRQASNFGIFSEVVRQNLEKKMTIAELMIKKLLNESSFCIFPQVSDTLKSFPCASRSPATT